MSPIETVRAVLLELATLAMVIAGLLVMFGGFSRWARRAALRAALLSVLLIVVSVLVTPEWLP